MALLCSKRSGWEKGSAVLQRKILSFAEISEEERDKLIKRHMVCSFIYFLSMLTFLQLYYEFVLHCAYIRVLVAA